MTGAVGLITFQFKPNKSSLRRSRAILMAREFLRDPYGHCVRRENSGNQFLAVQYLRAG